MMVAKQRAVSSARSTTSRRASKRSQQRTQQDGLRLRNAATQLKDPAKLVRESKFIKFGIVGASGVIVNNAILWLLVRQGMWDVAASVIATECAIITNFIGNSMWTWGDNRAKDHKSWLSRFGMFQLISLVALVATVALFWVFHNIVHLHLLVANTLAIVITFLINYTLNKRYTFKVQQ
jgi:dolichol-phosphate mannosyltransferase